MHLSLPSVSFAAVRSKAVVLLLFIRCWLLLPLWDSLIVLCFVVRYIMSILVLQSSWWGRESWLLNFVCLPGVSWLLCGCSSRCHRFICSLWLWCFLIILTIFDPGQCCFSDCFGDRVSDPKIRMCNLKLFFLLLNQNICCGYSKEPSQ